MNKKELINVKIAITKEAEEIVESLEKSLNTDNRANIIVSALKTLKYFIDQEEDGKTIVIRNEDEGVEKGLMFLYGNGNDGPTPRAREQAIKCKDCKKPFVSYVDGVDMEESVTVCSKCGAKTPFRHK